MNRQYIEGKGILVGTFNEGQIAKNIDLMKIKKAKVIHGLKHINCETIYKNSQVVGVRVYVCHFKDVGRQNVPATKSY